MSISREKYCASPYLAYNVMMSPKWFLGWLWAFPVFKILTGVEIEGRVPRKGAFIIASNHVSFLDPPALGICAGRELYFLAKIGLFSHSKFFSWLIRTFNAIPISGVMGVRPAVRLFRQGEVVVIFPEGTRSRKGVMLPFNPGVGYLAITFGIPVIPTFILNSDKKVFSLILRFNKLRIRFGEPIYPSGYKKNKKDIERFTIRLREEVLNLQ